MSETTVKYFKQLQLRTDGWPIYQLQLRDIESSVDIALLEVETTARHDGRFTHKNAVVQSALRLMPIFDALRSQSYRIWAFVAHGFWQDNTRLTRYRGLDIRHSIEQCDGVKEVGPAVAIEKNQHELRYAGVIEVSGEALLKAIELARTYRSCFILLSQNPHASAKANVEDLFRVCFLNNGKYGFQILWEALICDMCSRDDLIVRVGGTHDEPCGYVHVLGMERLLGSVVQNIETDSKL